MIKLVTIVAVLMMTAVFSPDSSAQCIGCSQGVAPSFAQPINTVQSFGTPVYNSAPVFNSSPVYNSTQVVNSTPVYDAAPVYDLSLIHI